MSCILLTVKTKVFMCVCAVLCTVCYLSMFGLQQRLGAVLSGIWKARTIAPSVTCLCFEGGNPVRWKHCPHTHTHKLSSDTHNKANTQIIMLRYSSRERGHADFVVNAHKYISPNAHWCEDTNTLSHTLTHAQTPRLHIVPVKIQTHTDADTHIRASI